ncbi:short chain dehydrogenase family protein [Collimonas fungivorans]|uniref:Short chain dehydrogenase family protein n=2 Tax=Collimonas fungivorans TaxID=158899 RepID=A0A127PBN3_9BURK|nr:short chain dehydrogenase family protein [Collimonas fungivorans]
MMTVMIVFMMYIMNSDFIIYISFQQSKPGFIMTKQTKTTVLITGASGGIGATYAERLAGRGHDLVLVARDQVRMEALASRLRAETGVSIDIIKADLTDASDLKLVEARLREDARIGLLVNNAGAAAPGGFLDADVELQDRLIRLNITAVTRLAAAVIPRFVAQGEGAIVNIASVVALAPEFPLGVYGATKAYVLTYSQALNAELGARGLYVQAVLPAATRTEIWERSGRDVNALQGVMEVGELVDAALLGFDRREQITIPSLPDAGQWESFNTARQAMLPNFAQEHAAERYRR